LGIAAAVNWTTASLTEPDSLPNILQAARGAKPVD
jgi:hypothetical protein